MKVGEVPPNVVMLHEDLVSCLQEWEQIIPRPLHPEMVEEWKNEMKNYLTK